MPAPEKPTGPIAAAVVDGFTTVFYVNSAGFLLQLANEYEDDGEIVQTSETYRENYNDDPVKAGKEGAAKKDTKDVKSETKDIAAISYKLPSDPADGPSRARIYYISPEGYLSELCKNKPKEQWFKGALDDKKIEAVPNSPITATWSTGANSIKVVFYKKKKDTRAPYVAWNDGPKGWQEGSLLKDE